MRIGTNDSTILDTSIAKNFWPANNKGDTTGLYQSSKGNYFLVSTDQRQMFARRVKEAEAALWLLERGVVLPPELKKYNNLVE